jgi:hypothetical protein
MNNERRTKTAELNKVRLERGKSEKWSSISKRILILYWIVRDSNEQVRCGKLLSLVDLGHICPYISKTD